MAENIDLVKSMYEGFGRGDVEAVLATFSDDIEWNVAEGMPYPTCRGPQEVAEKIFAAVVQDVEGYTVTPEELLADGDTVVALTRYTGTGARTGKALDMPVAHAWDVADGKLVRFRQFADSAQYLEVVPADASVAA